MNVPHISEIRIRNLAPLPLAAGAIVIIVGPNDGGKSTFLRDVAQSTQSQLELKWIEGVSWGLGTQEDFQAYIAHEFEEDTDNRFIRHRSSGARIIKSDVDGFYSTHKTSYPDFLIKLLDASSRIGLADKTDSPDVTAKTTSHPYHRFFYEADTEDSFSQKIESAFGLTLRVNRTGKSTGAFLGKSPIGDRLSTEYELEVLSRMEPLQKAGDGIRSYTGILLNASAASRPVTLIDEPEAFLHPPQARKLGKELAEEAQRTSQQTFVATHSSEIIQGALTSSNPDVHLLYLNRKGDTKAHYIPRHVVKDFSSSPFLAQTNALDALFYKRTIICEAPADITFFRWALASQGLDDLAHDSFWLPSYGKSAIPSMVADISKLGVQVACVFDIDVLLSSEILGAISDQKGINFTQLQPKLKALADGIRVPPAAETLQKISELVNELTLEEGDDDSASNTMREIRKQTSALGKSWYLKSNGIGAIPKGQLRAEIDVLLAQLGTAQVVVLREGEIENYAPHIGRHGPAWVRQVIETSGVSEADLARLVVNFKPLV